MKIEFSLKLRFILKSYLIEVVWGIFRMFANRLYHYLDICLNDFYTYKYLTSYKPFNQRINCEICLLICKAMLYNDRSYLKARLIPSPTNKQL